MSQSPFFGTPIGYADTINGSGIAISGIDCGSGVRAGTKLFCAATANYWTLTISAAVVDHTTVETALNFPAMRWIKDAAGGGGTVTTVGSADGSVAVANPTTTPDLSVRVISAANPGALATINVATNPSTVKTGSTALVASTGKLMVLQAALSGAANGINVVATADDVSRQWIEDGLLNGKSNVFETPLIDFTAITAGIALIPAVPGWFFMHATGSLRITAQTGVCTGAPTWKAGNNGTGDNMYASQSNPTLAVINAATAAIPWLGSTSSAGQGVTSPLIDMSTPATVSVTAGSTGTGGYTLSGKIQAVGYFVTNP